MQESTSFEKIMSKWHRLTSEQTELSVISMSGDSQLYNRKDEVDHLMPDFKSSAAMNVSTTVALADATLDTKGMDKLEDMQGPKRQDIEESKEAAGDTNEMNSKIENQSHDPDEINTPKMKTENEKEIGDNVDSAYLKPLPLHKTCSKASVEEEEDCGIKCLYYTLQCCDCVLM